MLDATEIKVGDRVWMGTEQYGAREIRTVTRVTATQIVIALNDNGSYLQRFRRDNGRRIAGGYLSHNIMRVATTEQCAAWDAKQLEKQRQEQQEELRKERIEALRKELGDLFGDYSLVSQEPWGAAQEREGKWVLELHGLTEQRIREIAAILKG